MYLLFCDVDKCSGVELARARKERKKEINQDQSLNEQITLWN
jgi:hypothetical protein